MEIPAINISEITGVEVSVDGQHALIQFRSGEQTAVLAFPFAELMSLMQAASAGYAKCLQIQDADPNTKHVLPCENFEITPSPDTEHMIFSFRLPGGMEMSYPVPRHHAKRLRDVMALFMQDPGKIPMGLPQ